MDQALNKASTGDTVGNVAMTDFRTTARSWLHSPFYSSYFQKLNYQNFIIALIGVSLALTILPLVITAWIELPMTMASREGVKLPFLRDWNVHFMFVLSFPLLFVYTVSDQRYLSRAVASMLGDRAVKIDQSKLEELIDAFSNRFTRINKMAQITGVITGLLVAFGNYKAYSEPGLGIWILKNNHFSITGYVYLYCIFIFYFTVAVYIIRTIAISLMFNRLLESAHKIDVYFHVDNCNGLSPIGTFAIRSQYLLTILTTNIIILYYVYHDFISASSIVMSLVIASILACALFGPLIFVVPLLPIHQAMRSNKTKLLNEISEQLRIEFDHTYQKLLTNKVSKEEGEAIDQLIKIRAIVDDMPVWPFDTKTLRRYLTAYMAPIALPLLQMLHGALK